MEILRFGFIGKDEPSNPEQWDWWSRAYEYPIALSIASGRVHNTAAGFKDIHQSFAAALAEKGNVTAVLNSDKRANEFNNYCDLYQGVAPEFLGAFDTVLCISAMEHMPITIQFSVFVSLLRMAKPGGLVLVTFDYPGFTLEAFEIGLNRKIALPNGRPLTGGNSTFPQPKYAGLKCGMLLVRRGAK